MSTTPSNVTYLYRPAPTTETAPRIRSFTRRIPTLAHILRLGGLPLIRCDLNVFLDITITRRLRSGGQDAYPWH